ncbi:hypothetical protein SAMN05880561_1011157 [Rhizobium sp. RU33A]|uniref:hypothetical protein n=1 Tax=Rhizobium sp. RU33A TaxID=1907413 RepID=UPI0009575239|nr:hypothetical protein [Rhizobium sp. RU33A]SIQ08080.1 hypothetical protein SAMN05880561_1011157 [Rhizobium sp. RU33A]
MTDESDEHKLTFMRWSERDNRLRLRRSDFIIRFDEARRVLLEAKNLPPFHELTAEEHAEFDRDLKLALHSFESSVDFRSSRDSNVMDELATPTKEARIFKPPGYAITGPLRFLLPKKVYERVVEQMVIDARDEYAEALADGHKRHAQWIAMRLYVMVGLALFLKLATFPLEKVSSFMQKD